MPRLCFITDVRVRLVIVCVVCVIVCLLKSEEVIRKYKVGATKYAFGGDSEQCVTFPWIDVDTEGRNAIRYQEEGPCARTLAHCASSDPLRLMRRTVRGTDFAGD